MSGAVRRIACLGIRGVSAAELERRMQAECAALPGNPSDCSQACDLSTLQKSARTAAPLLLGKAQ